MQKHSITFWRHCAQLAFFILFVYGGVIFRTELITDPVLPVISPPKGMPSTSRFERQSILWASDDPPIIDAYPPGATCRFNPGGGLVKACIFHMVSENLTWRTKLAYILPALLIFLIAAFLLGRWWCGWVCPLGTIGDMLSFARKKLRLNYLEINKRSSKILKGSSHFMLWSSLGISWLVGFPFMKNFRCSLFLPYCQICPSRILCPVFGLTMPSWRDFSSAITSVFTVLSWTTLAIFFAAFVIGRRLWCRICPIGLITSWFNRGSILELRKEPVRCNRCNACVNACPMANTHVRDKMKESLNHPDCIFCLRCLEQCPHDNCLSLEFLGKHIVNSTFR